MSKSRLLLIIVCLFLVHSQLGIASSLGTLPLTPQPKVSPTETNQGMSFLKEFNILAFALAMYYLDAEERLSSDKLKERLAGDLYRWEERFGVIFDLDKIIKQGFTRYYPFSVNNKSFTIRLFDIRDRHYLRHRFSGVKVICEGEFKEGVGFQILPGINDLLESKKIEKVSFQDPSVCSTYP